MALRWTCLQLTPLCAPGGCAGYILPHLRLAVLLLCNWHVHFPPLLLLRDKGVQEAACVLHSRTPTDAAAVWQPFVIGLCGVVAAFRRPAAVSQRSLLWLGAAALVGPLLCCVAPSPQVVMGHARGASLRLWVRWRYDSAARTGQGRAIYHTQLVCSGLPVVHHGFVVWLWLAASRTPRWNQVKDLMAVVP